MIHITMKNRLHPPPQTVGDAGFFFFKFFGLLLQLHPRKRQRQIARRLSEINSQRHQNLWSQLHIERVCLGSAGPAVWMAQ